MTLLDILMILLLAPLGLCACIIAIGYWATVRPRLEHQEKMFLANEQAKVNAINIQERQMTMLNAAPSASVGRYPWET